MNRAAPFAISQVAQQITPSKGLRLAICGHALTHPRVSGSDPSAIGAHVVRVRSLFRRCLRKYRQGAYGQRTMPTRLILFEQCLEATDDRHTPTAISNLCLFHQLGRKLRILLWRFIHRDHAHSAIDSNESRCDLVGIEALLDGVLLRRLSWQRSTMREVGPSVSNVGLQPDPTVAGVQDRNSVVL